MSEKEQKQAKMLKAGAWFLAVILALNLAEYALRGSEEQDVTTEERAAREAKALELGVKAQREAQRKREAERIAAQREEARRIWWREETSKWREEGSRLRRDVQKALADINIRRFILLFITGFIVTAFICWVFRG